MKLKYFFFLFLFVISCKKSDKQFTLTVKTNGEGETNLSSELIDADQNVQLIATHQENWVFKNWTGDIFSESNPLEFTMDEDKSIVANFIDLQNPDFEGIIDQMNILGGSLNETINDIIRTTDGGYVCVGSAQSTDNNITSIKGESDFLILKLDADLNVVWTKTYGGTSTEIARSVTENNGGYVVCGYTKSDDFDISEDFGQKDIWIVKVDLDGALVWEKSHGFVGDDEAYSIITTQSGGLFVSGYLDVTASGGQGNDGLKPGGLNENVNHGIGDFWGLNLDSDGEYIWRRYFGGFSNDKAYDVLQTIDGGFIIAGTAESVDVDITDPRGSYDIWITKVSGTGDLLWQKSFGGSLEDNCSRITPTNDGNFMVIGTTTSTDQDVSVNIGFADFWVVKFSPTGDLIWEKSYGGNLFDSASSITTLEDGNYLLSGTTRSDDIYDIKGQNDILLIKISPDGTILWEKTYGGSKIDVANHIIESEDNSIIVVGDSQSDDFDITTNNGFTDALIFELK